MTNCRWKWASVTTRLLWTYRRTPLTSTATPLEGLRTSTYWTCAWRWEKTERSGTKDRGHKLRSAAALPAKVKISAAFAIKCTPGLPHSERTCALTKGKSHSSVRYASSRLPRMPISRHICAYTLVKSHSSARFVNAGTSYIREPGIFTARYLILLHGSKQVLNYTQYLMNFYSCRPTFCLGSCGPPKMTKEFWTCGNPVPRARDSFDLAVSTADFTLVLHVTPSEIMMCRRGHTIIALHEVLIRFQDKQYDCK